MSLKCKFETGEPYFSPWFLVNLKDRKSPQTWIWDGALSCFRGPLSESVPLREALTVLFSYRNPLTVYQRRLKLLSVVLSSSFHFVPCLLLQYEYFKLSSTILPCETSTAARLGYLLFLGHAPLVQFSGPVQTTSFHWIADSVPWASELYPILRCSI